MSSFEYECALTGMTAEGGVDDDADGLGDLPVGWTRIQITRRTYNPRWLIIQQLKEAQVREILSQMPPRQQKLQEAAVRLQVDAYLHGVESSTPIYLNDVDDIVYVSEAEEALGGLNELRSLLDLPAVLRAETFGDVEEDDDDAGGAEGLGDADAEEED